MTGALAAGPILARIKSVDLLHLRFVVTAADHGSFRRAAEFLSVKQTTLSRSVRQFEDLIGVIVFNRSTAGIELTIAGRSLLRIARTILEEFDYHYGAFTPRWCSWAFGDWILHFFVCRKSQGYDA